MLSKTKQKKTNPMLEESGLSNIYFKNPSIL